MNTIEGMIKDLNNSELIADDDKTPICTTSGELIIALEKLAYYDNLEEQGRLIELPESDCNHLTKYKQEDFYAVRKEMTAEKAIEILEWLSRECFQYTMPAWGNTKEYDYENFKIYCAICFAINKLQECELK